MLDFTIICSAFQGTAFSLRLDRISNIYNSPINIILEFNVNSLLYAHYY
jgi:hypothetical protein